jgi:hypothetical protein
MKNFIAGLFKDQQGAVLARNALQENGFEDESINLLERTENIAVVVKNPPIQSIGIAAVIGAVVLGAIGAFLGVLVGLGVIQIPTLEPSGGATLPFEYTPQFFATSVLTGLMFGGVTGIILGVATRFWMNKYRKVDAHRRGNNFMLAVQTDDMRRETKAKMTMKEYGAVKFEEFRETWDSDTWSVFDEKQMLQTS